MQKKRVLISEICFVHVRYNLVALVLSFVKSLLHKFSPRPSSLFQQNFLSPSWLLETFWSSSNGSTMIHLNTTMGTLKLSLSQACHLPYLHNKVEHLHKPSVTLEYLLGLSNSESILHFRFARGNSASMAAMTRSFCCFFTPILAIQESSSYTATSPSPSHKLVCIPVEIFHVWKETGGHMLFKGYSTQTTDFWLFACAPRVLFRYLGWWDQIFLVHVFQTYSATWMQSLASSLPLRRGGWDQSLAENRHHVLCHECNNCTESPARWHAPKLWTTCLKMRLKTQEEHITQYTLTLTSRKHQGKEYNKRPSIVKYSLWL